MVVSFQCASLRNEKGECNPIFNVESLIWDISSKQYGLCNEDSLCTKRKEELPRAWNAVFINFRFHWPCDSSLWAFAKDKSVYYVFGFDTFSIKEMGWLVLYQPPIPQVKWRYEVFLRETGSNTWHTFWEWTVYVEDTFYTLISRGSWGDWNLELARWIAL